MINLSYTLTHEKTWQCIAVIPQGSFEPAFTHPYDAEIAQDTQAYRDWLLAQLDQPTTRTHKDARRLAIQHNNGKTVVLRLHQNALHGDVLRAALISFAATITSQALTPATRTHAGLDAVTDLITEQETELDPRRFIWITAKDNLDRARLAYIYDTEGVITALTPKFGLIKLGRIQETKTVTRFTDRGIVEDTTVENYSFWQKRAELTEFLPRVHSVNCADAGIAESLFVKLLEKQRRAEQFSNDRTASHNPDRYDDHPRGYWQPQAEPTLEEEASEVEELHDTEIQAYLAFHNEIGTNLSAYLPRRYDPAYTRPVIKISPTGEILILSPGRQARGITHLYTNAADLIAVDHVSHYTGTPESATYIGRKTATHPASCLQNTHQITKKKTREQVIQLFKHDLWQAMQADTPQRRELIRLAQQVKQGIKVTLLCWCSPLPCHGHEIKKAILYLIRTRQV